MNDMRLLLRNLLIILNIKTKSSLDFGRVSLLDPLRSHWDHEHECHYQKAKCCLKGEDVAFLLDCAQNLAALGDHEIIRRLAYGDSCEDMSQIEGVYVRKDHIVDCVRTARQKSHRNHRVDRTISAVITDSLIYRGYIRLEFLTFPHILPQVSLRQVVGASDSHYIDQVSGRKSKPEIWHDCTAQKPKNPSDRNVPNLVEEEARDQQ